MKKLTAIVFSGGLLALGACNDGGTVEGGKGIVDSEALQEGWTVVIVDDLGEVEVPFIEPVPDADGEAVESELADRVSLVLESNVTGSTADLAAGTLVDGTPLAPGEFTWELNETRDLATLTFFNETPGGLTLKSDRSYEAQLTVTENTYVEELETIVFDVQPQ